MEGLGSWRDAGFDLDVVCGVGRWEGGWMPVLRLRSFAASRPLGLCVAKGS
jgi:hypothetical protein